MPSGAQSGTTAPYVYTSPTYPVTQVTVPRTTPVTAPVTSPTTVAPTTGQPSSGSYTYGTSGSATYPTAGGEQTVALGSSTQIVVSPEGCGQALDWQVTPGSSVTINECGSSSGITINSVQTAGIIFSDRRFYCTGVFLPITGGTVGEKWQGNCVSVDGSTNATVFVTLISRQQTTVGRQSVATTTDSVSADLTAATPNGDTGEVNDTLVLDDSSLIVSERLQDDITNMSGTYSSSASLDLTSLNPT